jgi:hypothetical protein
LTANARETETAKISKERKTAKMIPKPTEVIVAKMESMMARVAVKSKSMVAK